MARNGFRPSTVGPFFHPDIANQPRNTQIGLRSRSSCLRPFASETDVIAAPPLLTGRPQSPSTAASSHGRSQKNQSMQTEVIIHPDMLSGKGVQGVPSSICPIPARTFKQSGPSRNQSRIHPPPLGPFRACGGRRILKYQINSLGH